MNGKRPAARRLNRAKILKVKSPETAPRPGLDADSARFADAAWLTWARGWADRMEDEGP